jgi:adenylate cyclase
MAIALLPFENLSTAAGGEVLASGIAESVLHQLASLAEIDVISRTSSFAFRERAADAREIGQQLGARFLLEGSVQSDSERMRVTTQLIDAETGADVWSMRFDRRPGDVFAIQDEIAVPSCTKRRRAATRRSRCPIAPERSTPSGRPTT